MLSTQRYGRQLSILQSAVAAAKSNDALFLRCFCSDSSPVTELSEEPEPDLDDKKAVDGSRVSYFKKGGKRYYQITKDETRDVHQLPSVTTILSGLWSSHLVDWAVKTSVKQVAEDLKAEHASGNFMEVVQDKVLWPKWLKVLEKRSIAAPEDKRDRAARVGTACHLLIDKMVQNPDVDYRSQTLNPEELQINSPEDFNQVKNVIRGFSKWKADSRISLDPAGDQVVYSTKYGYAGALDALGRSDKDNSLIMIDFKTSNYISNTHALQVAAYAQAYTELVGEEIQSAMIVKLNKHYPSYEVHKLKDLSVAFQGFRAALYLWHLNNSKLL